MSPKLILDLIARHESESSIGAQNAASAYDVVVGQAFKFTPPTKPISTMTINEVFNWQVNAIKVYRRKMRSKIGYSAVGRYQIVYYTLRDLVDSDDLDRIFDKETQDELAFTLLKQRGWTEWARGKISDDRFADALSQEWASLPYNTGSSYYAGDKHGNRSLVSRDEVMQVLSNIRNSIEV